jgi:hypothetical protein
MNGYLVNSALSRVPFAEVLSLVTNKGRTETGYERFSFLKKLSYWTNSVFDKENSMKNVAQLLLAIALVLPASTLSRAQAPPQDGTFVLICSMYGSADQGASAWNKNDACDLPVGFHLDKSYHQSTFNCCGGGATSDIAIGDIPAGIHLNVSGGHYWSVTKPIELIRLDDDGPAQREFRLHTYCGPEGWPGPGCNVKVDVYARKLQ